MFVPDQSTSSVWGDIISSISSGASRIIGAVQGNTIYTPYPYVYNGTTRTPTTDMTGLIWLVLIVAAIYFLFFRK